MRAAKKHLQRSGTGVSPVIDSSASTAEESMASGDELDSVRRARPNSSTSGDLFALADQLLSMLNQQIRHQRTLIGLMKRKRAAVGAADFATIESLCRQEQRIALAVTNLERQRASCMKKIAIAIGATPGEPVKIASVAHAVGGKLGEDLTVAAGALTELVRELRFESTVVRRAAEALAGHMTGIMQAVASAMSATPVYSQRGRIRGGNQLEFSVDVRS